MMYTMGQVLEDIQRVTGVDATTYIPVPPVGCPGRVQSMRLYSDVYQNELSALSDQTERLTVFFKHYSLPEVDVLPDLTAYTLYGFRFDDTVFRWIGVYTDPVDVDVQIEEMYNDYPFIFIMAAYKVVEMLKRDTH